MRVVTPTAVVLMAMFNAMRERYPNLTIQFDPSLSYETSIQQVRTVRSSKQITEDTLFPLFTFKKEVMKPFEGNRRFQLPSHRIGDTADALSFLCRPCEFNLVFQHYESDMIMYDTFEIMYLNKAAYNQVQEFTVTLPIIGDFKFFLIWSDLDSVEHSIEDNRYIMTSGMVTVRGHFLVMQEVPDPLIEHINLVISDYKDTVLYSGTV